MARAVEKEKEKEKREKKVKVSKGVNKQTTRDLPEGKSWWW